MKVVTLVPWRPGDDRRCQLWDWTRYYLDLLGWPVFTGDDGGELFSRAGSMNAAAEAAGDWDVAVLADADTVNEAEPLKTAVDRAATEGLVIPWTFRMKLSQVGTSRFVQGCPVDRKDLDKTDRTSPTGGGATVVVSRAAWDAVGGMDAGFRGYGNEDLAFVAAVETLVLGDGVKKVDGTVWHLWHKHTPYVGTAIAATTPNRQRWNSYQRARWKPDDMRKLLDA